MHSLAEACSAGIARARFTESSHTAEIAARACWRQCVRPSLRLSMAATTTRIVAISKGAIGLSPADLATEALGDNGTIGRVIARARKVWVAPLMVAHRGQASTAIGRTTEIGLGINGDLQRNS